MTSARRSALPGATTRQRSPHQSALRKGRVSTPNLCYFVTVNSADRDPLFANSEMAEIVITSLTWLQEHGRVRLMGFVIMPDHVHAAFVLAAEHSLSEIMDSFKGYTGKKLNELLGRQGQLWQSGFHDHFVRDRKDFETRLSYMHGNPVRKGLARLEHEYEYSSANPRYSHLIDWAWLDGVGRARKGALTKVGVMR